MRTLMVLKKWEEKCREKHSTTSRVSPYTYFVLEPLPACFVTEQSTVKASLFVKYNATQACSMEKLTDLYNLLTFEYITLLACLNESHVNYNNSRES